MQGPDRSRTREVRVAIVGWGRLGQACAAALHDSRDLALAGIVRRADSPAAPQETRVKGPASVSHISELRAIDVALVCVPTQATPGVTHELLQAGMPIVECAGFEGEALQRHHEDIAHSAERHRVGAVLCAGWDPGVLPHLQRLFDLLVPKGRSHVSRHVAAGLHHTAAARDVPGVQDALCTELSDASGAMQRYVYVQLACGADLDRVRRHIEGDPVFGNEPTHVLEVADLAALECESAGVLLERMGNASYGTHASLILEARLDPTAFTARLMVDAARLLPPHARGAWRYTPFGLVPWDPLRQPP